MGSEAIDRPVSIACRKWRLAAARGYRPRMFRPGTLLAGCALATLSCSPARTASAPPPPPETVQLGPWLADPGPRQMTVAWTTRDPLAGRVEVESVDAQGKPGPVRLVQERGATVDHRVQLQELNPGQRYTFQIAGDPVAHGSFITAPDPAADPFAHPFTVLVYGDNRTNGGDHALVVRAAEAQGAQLALHTGDMVVNAKDQRAWARWFDVERDLLSTTPLVPTVGNHEITDQGVTYSRHFKTPGGLPYHAFDYGNVHIQVLDSFEIQAGADPHTGAVSDAQKAWAEADAKSVPADHHLWMLVHQGPYTHPMQMRGGHGGLPGVRELISMVQKVHPVEAVFAGHEHFYERGEQDGLRYFVLGGGGAPLEDPDPSGSGVKLVLKALSFATLDVCGCHVTGATKDIAGRILDSYTLSDCDQPCTAPGFAAAAAPADAGAPIVGIPTVGTQQNQPSADAGAAP